jgi:sugar phosphate permease
MTPSSPPSSLPRLLIARLPFYYGWLVLGAVCCAGFARQGPANAVLSIFVEPMTREFGWSRAALSGVISLGGVLGALSAPLLGPVLDRRGARLVLCLAVLGSGIACMALSLTPSLIVFYVLFCFARMIWAGPFDLGIYGALNNWFVARRAFANATASFAQSLGLVALPLIAQLAITPYGWRAGWLAIGVTVLIVGFAPVWLLLVRQPEDLGLVPDRIASPPATPSARPASNAEPSFSRAQALRTRAFWLLALYTALVYPTQAGLSLHQAAHLIERGIAPATAAAIVSTFSAASALTGLACGFLPRGLPIRYPLMVFGALFGAAALVMTTIATPRDGYVAACLFGAGIGGVLTLVPVAWAEYFGRRSYGAIRSLALFVQVLAQAAGPPLSGALRDLTGDYMASLRCFAALSLAAILVGFLARPPRSLASRA